MANELDARDTDFINALAAQQMGQEVPPNPAAPPPQAAAPQAPAKPAEAPPTPIEQATTANAPKTESTKAEPFEFFEVDLGEGRKELMTPAQIRGMVPRYKDMNYQHQTEYAPIKNSVGFINQLRQQMLADGEQFDDEQMATFLQNAIVAYTHNGTMGQQQQQTKPATPGRKDLPVDNRVGTVDPANMEAALSQWEQDNAVSLPPMYKQAIAQTAGMSSQIEELKALVQQLAQSSNQTATAAGEQLQQAGTQRAQAGMQQIQNNLQSIQQKYQFSDDAEQAFMTFVNERGYMLEDLMDKTLADKLGSDFKAVQQSPEIDRLRAIAERRQAFTGTSTPSPTGGAATPNPAPSADQEFMDAATQTAMRNRNMIE